MNNLSSLKVFFISYSAALENSVSRVALRRPLVCKALLLFFVIFLYTMTGPANAQSTGFIPPTETEFSATPLRKSFFPDDGGAPRENLMRFFPPPLEQDPQASCMGFAFSYALLTAMEGQTDRTRDVPYSPNYIYNLVKPKENTGDCKRGAVQSSFFNAIESLGSPPMNEFPYEPSSCEPASREQTLEFSKMRKLANIERINDRGENSSIDNVSGARDALLNKQPVVVGMPTGERFSEYVSGIYPDKFYIKNVNKSQSEFVTKEQGLHAMVLVGYDNDLQAFQFINSYGQDWGIFGYGLVSYEHIRRSDIWLWTAELGQISSPDRIAVDVQASPLNFPNTEGPLIGNAAEQRQPSNVTFGNAPGSGSNKSPKENFGMKVAAALRGTVGHTASGQTVDGMDYYPVSVWLRLPKEDLQKISQVEYHWDAPSFVFSPKIPPNGSENFFMVEYNGYGAVNVAYLIVKMVNGDRYLIDYPFASLWNYGELNEKDMQNVRSLLNPDPLPNCPEGTRRRGRGPCITK